MLNIIEPFGDIGASKPTEYDNAKKNAYRRMNRTLNRWDAMIIQAARTADDLLTLRDLTYPEIAQAFISKQLS